MDGRVHCVINVKYILDVDMATVMEVHGNVFAILTGVAFYVIKVSVTLKFNTISICNHFENFKYIFI